MGVDYYTAKWLKRQLEGGSGRLLTLGRQNWWLTRRESKRLGLRYAPEYSRANYADRFFAEMGYSHESLDISLSEGADIKHDMSRPVDESRHGLYDVIVDLGTAEHVADQKQYWTNVYDLLCTGGLLIGLSPMDGLAGHGLYQFSPEFFQNMGGFSHKKLWITTYGPLVTTRPFKYLRGKPCRWRTYCLYAMRKTENFAMPVQTNSMVATSYRLPLWAAKFLLYTPGISILRRMFL